MDLLGGGRIWRGVVGRRLQKRKKKKNRTLVEMYSALTNQP